MDSHWQYAALYVPRGDAVASSHALEDVASGGLQCPTRRHKVGIVLQQHIFLSGFCMAGVVERGRSLERRVKDHAASLEELCCPVP